MGLNFVPTPCWTEKIETTEWLNLLHHIRRIEWSYVFNDGDHNKVLLPEKLKVTKFSRPRIEDLYKKTIAYTQMITSKLRNLKEKVIDNFKRRNNLNAVLNKSFKKLKKLVRNNDIIVCKTDKDGKLVIIDLATYNNIMKRELEQFQELNISQSDFEKKAAMVRKKCENLAITSTLHKEQVIDNNLLYHKLLTVNTIKLNVRKLKNFAITHRHISILCLKCTSLNQNFWNPRAQN